MTQANVSGPVKAQHEAELLQAMATGRANSDAHQAQSARRLNTGAGATEGDVVAGDGCSASGAEANRLHDQKAAGK